MGLASSLSAAAGSEPRAQRSGSIPSVHVCCARNSLIEGSHVAPATKYGRVRAFLRTHRPLTSTFGRRLVRLWGEFVGTYSAPAYAACAG